MRKEKAREFRTVSQISAQSFTDDEAINVPSLYPMWSGDSVNYTVDYKVKYNDLLYKCLQAHTSQATWTPINSPSLWVRIDNPIIEYPNWVQPLGSTDAYALGAKVTHLDKKWISDIEANVYEPSVYGWTEITE